MGESSTPGRLQRKDDACAHDEAVPGCSESARDPRHPLRRRERAVLHHLLRRPLRICRSRRSRSATTSLPDPAPRTMKERLVETRGPRRCGRGATRSSRSPAATSSSPRWCSSARRAPCGTPATRPWGRSAWQLRHAARDALRRTRGGALRGDATGYARASCPGRARRSLPPDRARRDGVCRGERDDLGAAAVWGLRST